MEAQQNSAQEKKKTVEESKNEKKKKPSWTVGLLNLPSVIAELIAS